MRRGFVFGIVLVVLLAGSLLSACEIIPVKSTVPIYIRADGSIDPPTSSIETNDKLLYVLSSDINGSVTVERNGITIDGKGHTLQSSGDENGISISSVNGVTLRNACIRGFDYGVYMQASQYNTISGNNIIASKDAGIYLYYSYNNNVTRNMLLGSGTSSFGGIRLNCASYNNIIGNNIESNYYGIYFYDSDSNQISQNNLINNSLNAYGAWDLSFTSSGNIWNDSYPFGGNYWTDYNGIDLHSGVSQNETGSDGIGDTPKPVQVQDFSQSPPAVFYELDNYPLMKPWTPYDNGTIRIKADGSVDPSGAPIQRKGDFYTLYDDINSDSNGIIVEKNGTTLDVTGNMILGNGKGNGITINQMQNVTLLNANVEAFQNGISIQNSSYINIIENNVTSSVADGIYLSGGENSMITNNAITTSGNSDVRLCLTNGDSISSNILTNSSCGMSLEKSNYNSVVNNNLTSNDDGLMLFLSSSNNLAGNIVENNTRGVNLQSSSSNTLTTNLMAGNAYSFGVFGDSLMDFMNSIDTSNYVDGKPVFYVLNESNVVADSESGYLGFINCRNITVEGLTLENNINGLLLAYTSNSTIVGNYVTKNQFGICLSNSSDNLLIENTASDNDFGVCFNRSSTNSILDNSIANNRNGIIFSESCRNDVARNNIVGNHVCMNLSASSNNLIYHNNFTNNEIQPSSSCDFPNAWDNGYPFGGNYWSDYNGTDFYKGIYQNETGSDGICDIPYNVVANNTDRYPLMRPWTPPEITVRDLQTSKTILGRGYTEVVNVSFENQGGKIEAFNAAIYGNSTLIHSEQFTIEMANLTISFEWNSSEFAYGVYTLRAYAEPCLGETNTTNNSAAIGNLTLTIPGDLTCDFSVDIYDAICLARSYGSRPGSSNWNPNADINNDNIVDIYDALILAGDFGKSVQL